jgi:hypothetical protein
MTTRKNRKRKRKKNKKTKQMMNTTNKRSNTTTNQQPKTNNETTNKKSYLHSHSPPNKNQNQKSYFQTKIDHPSLGHILLLIFLAICTLLFWYYSWYTTSLSSNTITNKYISINNALLQYAKYDELASNHDFEIQNKLFTSPAVRNG